MSGAFAEPLFGSATPSRNLASHEEEHRQYSALSEHLVHHFLHTFETSMDPVIEDLDAHLPDQHQTSGMFSFPSDALASMTTAAASAPHRQTAKAPHDAGGAPMRRGRSRGGRSQSRGRRMAMKAAQEQQQQHEQPSSPSPARRGRRSRSRSAAAPHKPSRSQSRRRSRSRARSRSRSRPARKRSQSGGRRTSRSRRR
uniref:Uncharacterized protein n=1 Tax=Anopheles melas TaxID=34690 RepID=A0A182TKS2_9DIPT